jgi:hypothetical protein
MHDPVKQAEQARVRTQQAVDAADAAYAPYRGVDVAAELPAARRSQAEAQAQLDDVTRLQQTVAGNESRVSELRGARAAAEQADRELDEGSRAAETARGDFNQARQRAEQARQLAAQAERDLDAYEQASGGEPAPDPETDPEAFARYMQEQHPEADPALWRQALAWIGRMLSSGQSWQDVLDILQQGKETVARLQDELRVAEALLSNLEEGLSVYRSALDDCLQEHGGEQPAPADTASSSADV